MAHAKLASKVNNQRPTWSERNADAFCGFEKDRKLCILKLEVFEYFIAGGSLDNVVTRFGPLVNCLSLKKLKREAIIWNCGYKEREREFEDEKEKIRRRS